ncbi:MAG TPA: hemolysin III family protein [Salinisphaeraceae bacterium]|nr:hemolysin III family protein [Salinisphaeraceae bacterium]
MSNTGNRNAFSPEYTLGEEIANSVSSGVAAALALAGLVVLIVQAASHGRAWHVVGVSVFGASLLLSHLASTLYHAIVPLPAKRVLRVLDHLAIYLLIAGTYTPFTLVNLRGHGGWWLFGLVWLLALFGLIIKLTRLQHVTGLATGFYVLMGWLIVLAVQPLLAHVALPGLLLLLAGGIAYTVGVVFFQWQSMPYNHLIWHLFIIVGGMLHYFAVLFYVIPYPYE